MSSQMPPLGGTWLRALAALCALAAAQARPEARAVLCPQESPGAAARPSWAEFCGGQACGDWDYASAQCWGLNAEKCGWSCGTTAVAPASVSAEHGAQIGLRERARYGRGKLLDAESTALRVRVQDAGAFLWEGNSSFDLIGAELHASPAPMASAWKLRRERHGAAATVGHRKGSLDSDGCVDTPANWTDVDGSGCANYSQHGWCLPDGSNGPNWHSEWGEVSAYGFGGHSALTACCACGGGSTGGAATTTETSSRAPSSTTSAASQHCDDKPAGWVDSDGDGCDTYEAHEWCLPDGSAGPWFGGDFERFANDGHTALTACCACGGGERSGDTAPLPSTSSSSACRDDPEGWSDSDGDSCDKYELSGWCTADGQPGPNFVGTAEDFDRFANNGHTALTACCACGGGSHGGGPRPTTPPPTTAAPECANDPEAWVDSDGDGCSKYEQNMWCTSDGQPGPNFGGTAEDFDRFANNGHTALTACCACGGGSHGGGPHPPPPPTTAAPECADDPEGWVDSDGDGCSKYEQNTWCTSDGQPGPNFGGTAEDFDRFANNGHTALTACCACGGGRRGGDVAPTTPPPGTCADKPRGWVDRDGDNCTMYALGEWCTADGQPGPNFGGTVDDFAAYGHGGQTALTACCVCGGGEQNEPVDSDPDSDSDPGSPQDGNSSAAPTTVRPEGCADDPIAWVDSDGDDCSRYEGNEWCTPDGQPGSNFVGTVEDFARFGRDGHTALTACCACGGGWLDGQTRTSTTMTTTTTPPPTGTLGCQDDPQGWVDSDGDDCVKYETNQWCTPDGQPGPNFDGGVEDFATYANHGHTALTACCACGGGAGGSPLPTTTAPSSSTSGGSSACMDDPQGWVDSDGDDCVKYETNRWCTLDGQPGPNFQGSVGDFANFANDGHTALTACCACGGGSAAGGDGAPPVATTTSTAREPLGECRGDRPEGWTDALGDDCDAYVAGNWCTPQGVPGPGWQAAWGSLDDFAGESGSAAEACCACGGGDRGGRAAKGLAPRSLAGAELHLLHADRRTGEQLLLVVPLRPGGPDAARLPRLGLGEAGAGAEVDLAGLATAIGGLGAASYEGRVAVPPCGGAPTAHRLVARRPIAVSSAQLEELACSLPPRPRAAPGPARRRQFQPQPPQLKVSPKLMTHRANKVSPKAIHKRAPQAAEVSAQANHKRMPHAAEGLPARMHKLRKKVLPLRRVHKLRGKVLQVQRKVTPMQKVNRGPATGSPAAARGLKQSMKRWPDKMRKVGRRELRQDAAPATPRPSRAFLGKA